MFENTMSKNILSLKLFLYRFFLTRFGSALLASGNFGMRANLRIPHIPFQEKYPFYVAITVDTESGYVLKNQRRVWQKEKPDAFVGYTAGIKNLVELFDARGVPSTFFLSTQCFASSGETYEKIISQLKKLHRGGHEIGLHLHPDSDFALKKKVDFPCVATSAFFYTTEQKIQLVRAAKNLILEHLGTEIFKKTASFRWGNWALDSTGVVALQKSGFVVDSSATPRISGHQHDTMKYDWSKVRRHYPWKLSTENYQNTTDQNSSILEIPIATATFFGIPIRADPVNLSLLRLMFDYYYQKAERFLGPFVFVVITHSSEATYADGTPTPVVQTLEEFISHVQKKPDVVCATLGDAAKELRKSLPEFKKI